MNRAAFLIALAVSSAAGAQSGPPALPLPGATPAAAAPALPLPEAPAAKPENKKKSASHSKKDAPALSLPLPGAPEKQEAQKDAPALPLPGAKPAEKSAKKDATATLPLPAADKPAAQPAEKSAKKDAVTTLPLPAAAKVEPRPEPKAAPLPAAPAAAPQAAPASTRTASAASEKPADASRAPFASAVLPSDLNLRGTSTLRPLWNVRGFIGAERSTEQNYTDSTTVNRLGVEANRWFSTAWVARLSFDWRSSRQQYVPLHVQGGARTVAVDESRYDVLGDIGYDFGPRLAPSGRLELTPLIGFQYTGIRNDAFPSDVLGVNVGLRTRYFLSPAVIPHLQVGYSYNFTVPNEQTQNSALKSPLGDIQMRAGLALPLAGGYALELDYQGDILTLQNTYRVAHGAALGFGTSF